MPNRVIGNRELGREGVAGRDLELIRISWAGSGILELFWWVASEGLRTDKCRWSLHEVDVVRVVVRDYV
jgi:hypothetical protein